MINLIGYKRLMILIVLLGINLALGALLYFYLIPENAKKDTQLSTLKSQINTTRNDTYELENNYKLIQEQKFDYENLVRAGFFNTQDRLAFRRRMLDIQKYTNVLRASFDIPPATIEEHEKVQKAEHVILKSNVSVDIDALDDVDLYNFLFWIENGFPGHTQITSVSVKREKDVNDQTLRQIGSGNDVVLVSGSVEYDWRTMVPQNQVDNNGGSFGEGF